MTGRSSSAGSGLLVTADGTLFAGTSVGAPGVAVGEVVFNTSMTGYQEVLSDPSYSGQVVVMTMPHIGNYGVNAEDDQAAAPAGHCPGNQVDVAIPRLMAGRRRTWWVAGGARRGRPHRRGHETAHQAHPQRRGNAGGGGERCGCGRVGDDRR